MKFPILRSFLVLLVSVTLTSSAFACGYSYLRLDDVQDLGLGKYDITMTFTTGAGYSGSGFGAMQNTWTFAFYLSGGATLTDYPASIVSPNTGANYSGFTVQDDSVLAYHNPYEWWTCIDANCGPVQPISYTVTIETFGLPSEITLLGMEGAGNPAAGCSDADMTVSTSCFPMSVDAGNEVTAYIGYPPAECVDLTANGSGGSGAFSYSWDTGASSQSINVCPDSDEFYFVTVTDATSGCQTINHVKVNYLDISCGNNKVLMCKNGQTRCISNNRVQQKMGQGWVLGGCSAKSGDAFAADIEVAADLNLEAGPNPFREVTTLRVTAPVDEEMSLRVYDINGSLVKVVQEGTFRSGESSYQLRSDGLTPGTYIARLTTQSGDLVTKKLLVQ